MLAGEDSGECPEEFAPTAASLGRSSKSTPTPNLVERRERDSERANSISWRKRGDRAKSVAKSMCYKLVEKGGLEPSTPALRHYEPTLTASNTRHSPHCHIVLPYVGSQRPLLTRSIMACVCGLQDASSPRVSNQIWRHQTENEKQDHRRNRYPCSRYQRQYERDSNHGCQQAGIDR